MDGIIIINKQQGCTSHDIVYKVKKIVNEKVGHTGTLDPMATGVLPLLIGKGTLCSKYLINHDKKYQVKLLLGKRTTTMDIEGEVIEEKVITKEMFETEKINKVFEMLTGKQEQIPPIYSAIKVNGKKLYEYARKGQEVEIKPRQIEIYKIELIQVHKETQEIEFEVSCSKGTYIRSLCEEIANKLGTVGYMSNLKRIQVGEFNIANSINLEELNDNKDVIENIQKHLISIEKIFSDKPTIEIEERKLKLLLNGVRITQKQNEGIYRIYCKNEFIGIGTIQENLLKRDIIL